MDANQVGYVHELTLDEVKQLLDDAITIKPKRQMSVQFSGGEPTLSPIFLESVAYARQVGYFSVQAATNGIRFAQDPDFAKKARDAGLRIAYLQFDGIGEEANGHRKVGNLFDVKQHAIENLWRAGIDIALVATIVNTINNDQVGPIIKFAVENCEKISFVSFQPVSFTGRDEDIDDDNPAPPSVHAVAPGEGREDADGLARAAARLVPAVGRRRVRGRHRPDSRAGRRVGHDEMRLPPELRNRRRADDQQEDQGVGAAHEVPGGRSADGGREVHRRRRSWSGDVQGAGGFEPASQLPALRSAERAVAAGPDQEVRQADRRCARRASVHRKTATAKATNGF